MVSLTLGARDFSRSTGTVKSTAPCQHQKFPLHARKTSGTQGSSPSQSFLSRHAMKGGGALRDETKTVSRETREEERVTRVCEQAGY